MPEETMSMISKIDLDGLLLTLAAPDTHKVNWIDYNGYLQQLHPWAYYVVSVLGRSWPSRSS
jgi:hypothetical protein